MERQIPRARRGAHIWFSITLAAILLALALWILGRSIPAYATLPQQLEIPTSISAQNVVTIGVAHSASFIPDIGWRQLNAVQLAVDQINATGGLDIGGVTYTMTLVSGDDGCDPTQAVGTANDLINAGVVAVVGHTCSGASNAAQGLYNAAGIGMVSPSSTNPSVTEQGYNTTFRVISRDDTPAIKVAEYLRERMTFERAAIVELDGFGANYTSDVFSDTFTSLGGSITSRHTVLSTADFTATLTAIQPEDPQAIYIPHNDGNVAGLLSKVADGLGMSAAVIAWNTGDFNRPPLDDYAAMAGAAAENDYAFLSYRAVEDMPGYAALNMDYKAAGFANSGDEAQMWGAFAYDALRIIAAAIEHAASANPVAIRNQIAATFDHPGVVGTYTGFDAKGDVIPQWYWAERFLSGEWVRVDPEAQHLPAMIVQIDDSFVATTLDSPWSWLNENPAYWSLTANPGYLRITNQSPGGENRLIRDAPQGDYEIRTHLVYTPTNNFHIAGLLIYQSTDDYLLLGRAFCSFSKPACAGGNGIYFDHVEGGTLVGGNFATGTSALGEAFLRIFRQGNDYYGYFSEDGQTWILIGKHSAGAGFAPNKIGLAVGDGGQDVPEIPADFAYFMMGVQPRNLYLPVTMRPSTH